MQCPKCGRSFSAGTVICAGCEFILDASFLGDDIRDDERAARPGAGSSEGYDFGEAVILGDAAGGTDAFDGDSFLGTQTGLKRLYVSGSSQALLAPDAVPALVADVDPAALKLSPFEEHLLQFVNGHATVRELQERSRLEEGDVKSALATLADKGVVYHATLTADDDDGFVNEATMPGDASLMEPPSPILGELVGEDDTLSLRPGQKDSATEDDSEPPIPAQDSGTEDPGAVVDLDIQGDARPATPLPRSLGMDADLERPSPGNPPAAEESTASAGHAFETAQSVTSPETAALVPPAPSAAVPGDPLVNSPTLPGAVVLPPPPAPFLDVTTFPPNAQGHSAQIPLTDFPTTGLLESIPPTLAIKPAPPADDKDVVEDLPLAALVPLPPPMLMEDVVTAPRPYPRAPTPPPPARILPALTPAGPALMQPILTPAPVRAAAVATATAPRKMALTTVAVPAKATTTVPPPSKAPGAQGSNTAYRQLGRAARIFEQALKDAAEGNFTSARMNAKLAAINDPTEPRYSAILKEWDDEEARALKNGHQRLQKKSKEIELFEAAQEAEGRGDFEEAVQLLEAALKIKPNFAQIWNRLGVVQATRLKRYDRALECVQRAMELDPSNAAYMNNLGKVIAWQERGGGGAPAPKKKGLLDLFKR